MKQLMTKSSMYGIHLLTFMASTVSAEPIQLRVIAEGLDVSRDSLAKIIRSLNRAGLLGVARGCGGGCTLRRSPDQITVLQVIEAVDGPCDPGDPLLDKPERQKMGLRLTMVLRRAVEELENCLSRTSIADLAGGDLKLKNSELFLKLRSGNTMRKSRSEDRLKGLRKGPTGPTTKAEE